MLELDTPTNSDPGHLQSDGGSGQNQEREYDASRGCQEAASDGARSRTAILHDAQQFER